MSTWCSAAILRTTGDERVRRNSSAVISARGFSTSRAGGGTGACVSPSIWKATAVVAGGAGRCRGRRGGAAREGARPAGVAPAAGEEGPGAPTGAPSPSAAITPTTVWMATVVPGATRISLSTPAAGEGISASTLSVEISNRGSSRSTRSPTFLNHFVTVPSAIDSPICGMMTSAMALLARSRDYASMA